MIPPGETCWGSKLQENAKGGQKDTGTDRRTGGDVGDRTGPRLVGSASLGADKSLTVHGPGIHGPGIHGSFIGVLPSSYKLETYVSLCRPVLIYGGFTGRPCDH